MFNVILTVLFSHLRAKSNLNNKDIPDILALPVGNFKPIEVSEDGRGLRELHLVIEYNSSLDFLPKVYTF